ncbi:uncharacterized protein LOC135095589 isoform X2 [Scylla paramamosain]|uniref:uncharacterized protein LOC135095589 isoform X2 n=1 Tax=Scylla paramamosain TaxID=85552 RepID=UPI003082C0BB
MDDNVEDCPVCFITFDDTLRRPRTLPCGHTLCSPCIDGLKQQDAVTCPTCRASHAVPGAGHFPISYITEDFIRGLRGRASLPAEPGKQAAPPVRRPAPKATTGLSKRAQSLLQEQEATVLAAIRSCQEEQSQLAEYLTTLGGWSSRQQRLQDELWALVDQSKSALEAVRREESRVEGRQEEVWQKEQQLHAALQSLRTAATRQEAYEVIEDTDHLMEKDSQRTGECLGVFPDVHAVTIVTRVACASRAALQAATTAAAATQAALEAAGTAAATSGDSSFPAAWAAASSIADRLQALLEPPLTAEDLHSLTQRARGLVEAGLVFAVQDVKGQTRHARISLEDGRLHLLSLQAQVPPPGAATLQVGQGVALHPGATTAWLEGRGLPITTLAHPFSALPSLTWSTTPRPSASHCSSIPRSFLLHALTLPTLLVLPLCQPLSLPPSLPPCSHTLPTLPALPLRQAVFLPPPWRWGLSQQHREGCTTVLPPPHWCPWRCGRWLLSSSSQCQYSSRGNHHLKHHQ